MIAIVAAVILVAAAALAGSSVVSSPSPPPPPPPRAGTAPAGRPGAEADPAGTVRYRDYRVGFSIAYPKGWVRVPSKDPTVDLIVAQSRAASLLVRAAPVGLDVTPETLPVVRSLTDALVRADRRVQVLGAPQALVLDGLPGYRYIYTFATPGGGRGAHVHYFVFKRKRLISLVFQAVPATRLVQLSALFERLAATFRGSVG